MQTKLSSLWSPSPNTRTGIDAGSRLTFSYDSGSGSNTSLGIAAYPRRTRCAPAPPIHAEPAIARSRTLTGGRWLIGAAEVCLLNFRSLGQMLG